MKFNYEKTPIFYSVGTSMSYWISQNYYDGNHYVWCTTAFFDLKQPATSDPCQLCERYLKAIVTQDRHECLLLNHITGILRGIKTMYEKGVISKREHTELSRKIATICYTDLYPVLYIIPSKKIIEGKDRYIIPCSDKKASPNSVEFIIPNLRLDECNVIFMENFLDKVLDIKKRKVKNR